MAATDYPVNHPAAVKHWARSLFKEALVETYGFRFMGKGENNLIQMFNEMKSEGDLVKHHLRIQLSGDGVSGDNTLEGNEDSLTVYQDSFLIDQLRYGVKSKGRMSEQRVPWAFREQARDALRDWWAKRMDQWMFNHLAGDTTVTDTKYTGFNATTAPTTSILTDATSTASLGTADTFSIKYIDYCEELARNHTYPIRPIRVGGKDMYVMFVHDYQYTDMRRSYGTGEWGDIQKQAIAGGQTTNNPIFNGSVGVYNNTIIHRTSLLPTTGTANTRRAVFCGAQALGCAFGKGFSSESQMDWHEELDDRGNALVVTSGLIGGLKKAVYNSVDHAVINVPTYAAAHT